MDTVHPLTSLKVQLTLAVAFAIGCATAFALVA
jgi:hypothetical protein